jgi:hypothetical protein
MVHLSLTIYFASIIREAPAVGGRRRVYLSRCLDDPGRWVLRRRRGRFDSVTPENFLDVSIYRRNFDVLDVPANGGGLL